VLAPVTHFVVTGFPASTVAGTAGTFTITAQDDLGRTFAGYRGTVHFTSSDPLAALPADYTFTAADNGRAVFPAALLTAGIQSITATDTQTSSVIGTQAGIVVRPTVASALGVSGFPSPTTAGVVQSFTVTARDRYGNIATGYRGTVHFTSSDSQAALPADYTFIAADNGVHTLMATLKTAGTQVITATDTVNPSFTGTQGGIVVNPAAASSLMVSDFPSPTTAGAVGAVLVTALDPYGNIATGYQGTVHLTSSDPQAVLEADHTFTAADGGRYAFGAVLKTAGTQSLTATDTANPAITGTQAGIVVNPAATSAFVVAGYPSPTGRREFHDFTVTAVDPYGNLTPGYTGTVTFSSDEDHADLPGDYTFTAADAGMHTFSAAFNRFGTFYLAATDTANPGITGRQSGIVVDDGGGDSPPPAPGGGGSPSAGAGAGGSLTAAAAGRPDNTVTGYTGPAPATGGDGQAVLAADYVFGPAAGGRDSFSAVWNTPGAGWVDAIDALMASLRGQPEALPA
jgi:hypothetical protein